MPYSIFQFSKCIEFVSASWCLWSNVIECRNKISSFRPKIISKVQHFIVPFLQKRPGYTTSLCDSCQNSFQAHFFLARKFWDSSKFEKKVNSKYWMHISRCDNGSSDVLLSYLGVPPVRWLWDLAVKSYFSY